MSDSKLTVGQAIDQVAKALSSFDAHEQATILTTVCALLKIPLPTSSERGGSSDQHREPKVSHVERHKFPTATHSPGHQTDIRSLKSEKQPASAREMACVVAYYLAELAPDAEKKSTVTNADIERYFKQAAFRLPERLEQLLPDAKKAGYFESESRGEYRLTRVGHNLVVHSLPAKEKS